MNWILISVIANTILGVSAVFDKLLLKRRFSDPFVYVFWAAISGLVVLVLVPFGFHAVATPLILLAFLTGLLWFVAAFFFFSVLVRSEASVALPIIGALAPVATLFFSYVFGQGNLGIADGIGFFFLILGGMLFLSTEKEGLKISALLLTATSALFFGLSNVFTKIVFNYTSFISGFVLIRVGAALGAFVLFLFPFLRMKVKNSLRGSDVSNWTWYLSNRALAAVGLVVSYYVFALTHPALADASNGFKYIIILFASWILLHERFGGRVLFRKSTAAVLIVLGLLWLGIASYANDIPVSQNRSIQWGVTFSEKFSKDLGLDWQKNFLAIADELHPQKMRLIAYWDEIEKERGAFDFTDLDWQISEAAKRNIPVVLVIGMKVPRWPECHNPSWADELGAEDRESALHDYMKIVIEHYRGNHVISMWQVENEPYLMFGTCTARGNNFLEQEIALVKSFDSLRPVLITDGGEFGLWYTAVRSGDVFGTTMYRRVYPRFIGPIFGVVEYPLAPSFFRLKEQFVRWVIGEPHKKFIVVELQAEPWEPISLSQVPYEEQMKNFNADYFIKTIDYAKETGFDEYYLWGSEWWYWLKEKHNDSSMWDEAKLLFKK